MVVSICASMGWISGKLDVKTAFLRSDGLLREVHVQPPSEAREEEGWVWRLKKAVYGLGDAPREWFQTVKKYLIS